MVLILHSYTGNIGKSRLNSSSCITNCTFLLAKCAKKMYISAWNIKLYSDEIHLAMPTSCTAFTLKVLFLWKDWVCNEIYKIISKCACSYKTKGRYDLESTWHYIHFLMIMQEFHYFVREGDYVSIIHHRCHMLSMPEGLKTPAISPRVREENKSA